MDYFRFPGAYMSQAYSPSFFTQFLPALFRYNLVKSDCIVIAPNLKTLRERVPDIFYCNPINKDKNPLYTATETLSAQELGGYVNSDQLDQLDQNNPFLEITFKNRV